MSDENQHATGRTALDLALAQPWLIQRENLETILSIAGRWSEGPEAVAQRIGRPLNNARGAVRMRGATAVIPVTGPIFRRANLFTEISGATSIEVLALDFRTAMDDPAVESIVLEIDSPGGSASGVAEFAQQVFDARGVKPVTAYVGSLGASAALWIATAADRLVINETAAVGSIGVVAGMRIENDPNRIEVVSSQSPRKRVDPATPEGRAEIQALVDDLAQVFVETVARNRGVDVETVLSDFGQGGVLVGARAVKVGLADELGSLEAVIAGLSGSSKRGERGMTMKHPSPDITRETIAEHYPAIADAFRAEGVEQATATLGKDHRAALEQARTEGATAERERIQSVEAVALPGHGELIAALKFDGKTTGPEAAAKIIAAEKQNRAKRGQQLGEDRRDALVPAGDEEGASDPGARAGEDDQRPLEERCKEKWGQDAALRAEFGEKFDRYLAFERNKGRVRLHRPAA